MTVYFQQNRRVSSSSRWKGEVDNINNRLQMSRSNASSRLPLRPRPLNVEPRLSNSDLLSEKPASKPYQITTSVSSAGSDPESAISSSVSGSGTPPDNDSSTCLQFGQQMYASPVEKSNCNNNALLAVPDPAARRISSKFYRKQCSEPPRQKVEGADDLPVLSIPSRPQVEPNDSETVVIKELRKNSSEEEGHTVHEYLRGNLLGKGGFAKVYCCTSMETNRVYAVKIVPKANLVKARAIQKLQTEIKIHRTLKHKSVCEYKHFFEDKTNCYILLELCHHQSMSELIKRRKRLTEPEVRYYMAHLIDAVKYMHSINVIHRDLKLGNLFLDKQLRVKVGDLGLASKLTHADEKRKTICGTPNYIAPEVIDGNKETRGHSFEVDIWSMGVIFYTTLAGKPPYESKDVKSTYQRILANEYSFPGHIPFSEHARVLISQVLQTRPEHRPSLDKIIEHPFFTDTGCNIPASLPASATHVAPDWHTDKDGNLVALHSDLEDNYRSTTYSSRIKAAHRKPAVVQVPRTPPSQRRLPLTSKDVNVETGSKDVFLPTFKAKGSCVPTESNEQSVVASRRKNEDISTVLPLSTTVAPASTKQFNISNDAERGRENRREPAELSAAYSSHQSLAKGSQVRATFMVDKLIEKVSSCTIIPGYTITPCANDANQRQNDFEKVLSPEAAVPPPPPETTQSETASLPAATLVPAAPLVKAVVDEDAEVLEAMYARLRAVIDRTEETGNRLKSESSFEPVDVQSADIWVTRYVDYTSKYGLGFLLNDGSAGVYFNDSTKAVLAPEGNSFLYVERNKSIDGQSGNHQDQMGKAYTLSSYPDDLQKKVTLLKLFWNYLINQQKLDKDEEDFDPLANLSQVENASGDKNHAASVVFLQKWVRTKHAILFRLSNRTVQVIFYDHTEILLTSEARLVTYVDKKKGRSTYHLDNVMIGSSHPDIKKRLKYSKGILHQLIAGTTTK